MSRYKAYQEYKDSGVEWLGNVPTEWKLCPLKFMARIKNGQDYKRVEADDGYPVIGSGGQFSYASQFTYNKASVLLGRKGTIDKPLYINEPFWTVDTMYYTEVNEDVDPKFLYYLALTIQFSRYATNTALPSMTQENLGNYIFAIPTNSESRKNIAAFLDHETAKIDALIEKQQRLIELLKEKRQAVISHAVTKGLNPSAPMKDSGVGWLGRIPRHWAISKLRYKFAFSKGLTITKENLVEDGIPCVNYGEVHSKFGFEVNPTKHSLKCVDESYLKAFSNCLLSKGDFVFADTSEDLDGSGNFTQLTSDTVTFAGYHTIIARPEGRKNTRYFAYLFDAKEFRTQIQLAVKGVKVFSITQAILRGADIWLPSDDEQKNIVAFLDHETAKIDTLIEKQQRLIELAKERRTALISAAVTGKIDVRDWQAAA